MNKKKSLRELILEFRLRIANDFKIERTPTQIFAYFKSTLNDDGDKTGNKMLDAVIIKQRVCEVIDICLKDSVCYHKIASNFAVIGKQEEQLDCRFKF